MNEYQGISEELLPKQSSIAKSANIEPKLLRLSRPDLDHFIHERAQLRIGLPTAIYILHPTFCGDVTMRKRDLFTRQFSVVEVRIWPDHAKRAAAGCQRSM
jgi:hypothetical protein